MIISGEDEVVVNAPATAERMASDQPQRVRERGVARDALRARAADAW